MAIDLLQNYNEATVTTSLNGTDAAGTSDAVTISSVLSTWISLSSGVTQMRVMDKNDLALTSGYEIMILTADNAGVAGSWTLTRGAEGSTIHTHTANWTMVPANTAGGLADTIAPSQYVAEMFMTAAWTIGTTDTIVPFDTVSYDPNSNCTTGASAKYTCPVAGIYTVDGAFQATTNTLTIVRLDRNGTVVRQVGVNNALAANITGFCFSYKCAAADTLQIALRANVASSAMATGQILSYTAFRLHSTT